MNRILILAFVLLATTTSMADAGKKGSKVSFPNNVSGASFIRACENSGGQIDGGDNTLSCTTSSSETNCSTNKDGTLDACITTPTRTPPRKDAANSGGNNNLGNGNVDSGNDAGGSRPDSASAGNDPSPGAASSGNAGNTIN